MIELKQLWVIRPNNQKAVKVEEPPRPALSQPQQARQPCTNPQGEVEDE